MLGSDLLGSSQALKSVTSSYNDSIMAVMTGMHASCTCSKNYYNNFTIVAKEAKQSTQSSWPSVIPVESGQLYNSYDQHCETLFELYV